MIKTIRYKIKSVINFIKHFIFLFKQLGIISSIKFLKIENQDYTEKPYGDDKFTILNYRGGQIYLRNASTDIYLFKSILLGQYKGKVNRSFGEYRYCETLDINGKLIIDAGANIGLFAVLMALKFPKSKIICLEPEDANFQQLVFNTRKYKNIICYKKGLWNKNTYLTIHDRGTGPWGFQVLETKEETSLHGISLNDILDKYNELEVGLVKMDIEGSEYSVFSSNLQWLDKVKYLVIETHDHIIPGSDELVNKVMVSKKFEKLSFEENQFFYKK